MKRKLLLITILIVAYSYGQTACPLDQSVFSGTVTVSGVGASETKASDATSNHRFGERVTIDGNIAVVASRSNGTAAGKVYIFINDGAGNWTEQTILTASDGFAGDNFGSAVAIDGNYVVAGARSQLDGTGVDTGAAYLFEYNGVDTWTEIAIFEPSDGATGDRFGESVDVEGDIIIVGARNGCTGGCAYVYEDDGTNTNTYTETKLEPQVQSGYSGARFGHEVKIVDGRAYVGGPYDYSSVGNASAGSVQIWDQANDGSWSRTHRLRGTETTESFGWAVDVQGDYLAIGAMNFETSTTPEADQGRVYVYKADSNGDYLEVNRVMIQNDDKDSFADQRFGTDVVLDGEYLYVGTFGNGSSNTDAVYIFQDDGTNNWTQISKITSGAGWDEFANRAVAVSFPTLLIGQNEADSPSNSGSVYFVQLNNDVQPVASVTETIEASPSQSNGGIKVSFSDEATETQIKFSIDGGTTYPYVFDDTLGSGEITNLVASTYDVWVAFDETSCPINLGDVTVNEIRYTTIPDANFEAELESLGYDDISGDNQVPTANIEAVTTLNVRNKSISDLTGIEDFVALITLNCRGNNLTSLDISQNVLLETLTANDNNIEVIDVSNNTALKSVNLGANNLTTLDVSNNTALELLSLQANSGLTSIDISNNVLLEELRTYSTNIASLDLSAHPSLELLQSYNSALTAIDVSNNPVLEELRVNNTGVTELDLSNNPNIINLRVNDTGIETLDLSNQTALQNLFAYDTSLSYLNVKNGNNTNVGTFRVEDNPNLSCVLVDDVTYSNTNWTDKDATTSFSDAYCRYTAIPDANFEAALEALGYDDISADGQVPTVLIEVVTSLDISNLSITDITGIEDFTSLKILTMYFNNIADLNLSGNTVIEELYCNSAVSNSLNVSNMSALKILHCYEAGFATIDLSNATALEELQVYHSNLTSLDVSTNTALKKLYSYEDSVSSINLNGAIALEELYIYRNGIANVDITTNKALTTLHCYEGNLTTLNTTDITTLEDVQVYNNSNLETLDVSTNTGLKTLNVSGTGNTLTYLNLQNGNNANITSFDATTNFNLTCILVDDVAYSSGNSNWEKDATTNYTLTYCRYTAIPDANFEAVLEALGYDDISDDGQVPTALIQGVTSITAQFEDISDFTGIEDFTALESLTISYNLFTSLDVSNNTNLSFLNCGYSNLTSLDVSNNLLLETLWVNNTAISSLDLSLNTNLQALTASSNSNLTSLNVQNGNNTNVTNFTTVASSNLSCIRVDDTAYSTTNWTNIESSTTFSDTYCRYTVIPDANFETELEALGYDDISGDGQVPTTLIEVVTTLNVNNKGITDLTGIEDFVALTSLTVSDNNIGVIDVSNNINLKTLDCQFAGLSALDVSSNTALENLYANGNSISSIDVTNNTDLVQLGMYDNDLTSIDVSNNTALTVIDLFGNQLNAIDVSNNLLLKDLLLESNNITSLDVSVNTALKNFTCNSNSLESLNIQNGTNANISTFNATNNPSLRCILVDNVIYSTTNWTSIDVTASFNEVSCNLVVIAPKVFLQGALLNPNVGEESLMRDDLRVEGGIYGPTSPYGDGAIISESIGLDDEGSNSTVDWIWVELRDATDPTVVIAGQSGILQRDGDIVDVADDLVTPLTFDVPVGDYYVVIKHRNHLGIMTAAAISLSPTTTTIDFTDATNQITYGGNAQTTYGMPSDILAMWAGDTNGDGKINLIGSSNDANTIRDTILNDPINQAIQFYGFNVTGYNDADVNLTGGTQIIGNNNDANLVRDNILNHPINSFIQFYGFTITEQLPEEVSTKRIALDTMMLEKMKALAAQNNK
ncbi:hypothetical protein [uncultured Aquimarina sp.]|uniref:hypothetical protein n=1 Tax=uncultured Aquimarina sp. TaxID=575652 RepID=UPI0026024A45|nr:hypothetical protein [uncultured Aquimarina sp.]